MISQPLDNFLIVGDFNLSGIIWLPNDVGSYSPSNYRTQDEQLLIDEINSNNLGQYNGIPNAFGRILDLVLSNKVIAVSDCDDPLVPADPHHGALSLSICFSGFDPLKASPSMRYRYDKGDYDSLSEEISNIDWTNEFCNKSLESSVDFFYSTLYTLRDKYIPHKLVVYSSNPKWYSSALIKAIKEKRKYEHKYKTYKNRCDLESYYILRKRVKYLETLCYHRYISSVEYSIQNNPKTFWSYIKSRRNCNSIPSSMKHGTQIVNSGESICNAFSEYFESTFSNLNSSLFSSQSQPVLDNLTCDTPYDICSIEIDQNTVRKLLLKIDPSKSPAPLLRIFLIVSD
ncbi:hypothetical protein ABMA27_000336 [Loxostege sticticalis]|uniref:Endonuclease/exonuclease/phosphatase domain-containing protein n=1 Tax=Loxostege sticticalis TaxID=481309 RepID=A0ABR3IN13_LOXSC